MLSAEGLEPRAILVCAGRVDAIVPYDAVPEGMPTDDHGDHVVMPGLVDCHVHVNEPGRTEWEGFETATRAAASGGVTTLVDMPLNSSPVTTTRDALDRKRDATDGQLSVDVGFWGGVVPGNAGAFEDLARGGALGCKAFLCDSGIDDFPKVTEADLREAMPRLRDVGLPLLAHAELELSIRMGAYPRGDYRGWLYSRPPAFEDRAIELLVRLCRETRCAVHVVHLSSASALPIVRAARDEGLPFTAETCPHYLCLTAEEVPAGDTTYKCAPPIREAANREKLWEGLSEGLIDFVVTDHSPCTPGLKHLDDGDFQNAWGGIASLSLGLPSVWTEARARGFGLDAVARWMSERPASFAGLADRKGRIAPGLDADLVVWDPDARVRVTRDRLRFRHKVSPYLGRELFGDVTATYLRGAAIWRDGRAPSGAQGEQLLGRR